MGASVSLSVEDWINSDKAVREMLRSARSVSWRDLRRFYNRWCWSQVAEWPEPGRTEAFHSREGRSLAGLQAGAKGWLLARGEGSG